MQHGPEQELKHPTPIADPQKRAADLAQRLGQSTLDDTLRQLLGYCVFVDQQRNEARPLLQELSGLAGQFYYAWEDAQKEIAKLKAQVSDQKTDAVVTDIQKKRQA